MPDPITATRRLGAGIASRVIVGVGNPQQLAWPGYVDLSITGERSGML